MDRATTPRAILAAGADFRAGFFLEHRYCSSLHPADP
jgi:hypothetical protein